MHLDQYSYWLTVRSLDGAIDHDKAQEIRHRGIHPRCQSGNERGFG